ncbi:siderophore iron transporter [Fusarium beomiforme]|uniref:Siderophore iron transporter n=1 Tax=Fusarium beomiforme TaxID=44412 RepID=A0A9P5AMN7_9HYPO|nr:siderophore iron transporter [Fusarium beomiforme]
MSSRSSSEGSDRTGESQDVESQEKTKVSIKSLLLLLSINLVYFVQVANVVGSGALTRDIAAVVGGSNDSVWYSQVIAISTAVLGIPASQAADLWGRKEILVFLTSCGFIGSLIIAKASSSGTAIVGFGVSGISYGAQPLLHAISSEVVARKYRPWAQGSINVAASLGAILGLIIGGLLTRHEHHVGFRTYWYMVAGIYAAAAVSCQLLYNPPPRALELVLSISEKLRNLDWVGYGFLTPALVLFCMSLAWSGNPYSRSDAHVLATFLIGMFLGLALIVYELWMKTNGMFHHRLFQDRNFALALGCIFAEGMAFHCGNNYFAFEVGVLFETDSLVIGGQYSMAFVALGVSAIVSGIWCSMHKALRFPIILAFGFKILFMILMATVSKSTPQALLWIYPLTLGLGLGVCMPALITVAHFATPRELIAITSGLMISIRSLGGSIGLAVFNAIFSHGLSSNLGPKIAHAVLPLGFPEKELPQLIPALAHNDTVALKKVRGITPDIIEAGIVGLLEAYRVSFRGVWLTTATLCFIASVAGFFLCDPTDKFTSQVDAPITPVTEVVEVEKRTKETNNTA